jgi:hypothetical protein
VIDDATHKAISNSPELRKLFKEAEKRRKALGLPDPKDDTPEAIEMFRRGYAYLRELDAKGEL